MTLREKIEISLYLISYLIYQ